MAWRANWRAADRYESCEWWPEFWEWVQRQQSEASAPSQQQQSCEPPSHQQVRDDHLPVIGTVSFISMKHNNAILLLTVSVSRCFSSLTILSLQLIKPLDVKRHLRRQLRVSGKYVCNQNTGGDNYQYDQESEFERDEVGGADLPVLPCSLW